VSRKHGQTTYFIEGEGFVGGSPEEGGLVLGPDDNPEETAVERPFRFSRIFPKGTQQPSEEALTELGKAMDETPNLKDHDTLPAGFTYLGQFIDHDITFDKTEGLPSGILDPAEILQGRSPSLDLDSVYGRGPALEEKKLYADDKIHLRIGSTTSVDEPNVPEGLELPNDLPRGDNPEKPLEATIGDPRNDENLAVAQTHLAFLKFHNLVVDRLAAEGHSGEQLFDEARRTVVLHYQWIVLHDFLPRVIEPAVLDDVLRNGPRFFQFPEGEEPPMPIEFSVAAYRFGHSMIREGYTWNRVFDTEERGSLVQLFNFSGVSGNMFGFFQKLPSNWPIDWRRFYELDGAAGVTPAPAFNRTRTIDTALAIPLNDLPEHRNSDKPALAVRNLHRGRLVELPSGQAVAEVLGVPTLTPAQVAEGPHGEILRKHGLDHATPLWYYILKEAEVLHNGQRLGPVGSRILAETFVGLIKGSQISLLAQQYGSWKPTLPGRTPGEFTMADLLLLVSDLNPLGDSREPRPEPTRITHIVQPGDTLRGIARRFLGDEMRWPEIRNANRDKIGDPDLIHPGVELVIVVGGSPAPIPNMRHIVREGETLRSIARRFLGDEMRWPEIRNANRDKIGDPDLIHPGVELDIPSS
jgi:hypothetical protein